MSHSTPPIMHCLCLCVYLLYIQKIAYCRDYDWIVVTAKILKLLWTQVKQLAKKQVQYHPDRKNNPDRNKCSPSHLHKHQRSDWSRSARVKGDSVRICVETHQKLMSTVMQLNMKWFPSFTLTLLFSVRIFCCLWSIVVHRDACKVKYASYQSNKQFLEKLTFMPLPIFKQFLISFH